MHVHSLTNFFQSVYHSNIISVDFSGIDPIEWHSECDIVKTDEVVQTRTLSDADQVEYRAQSFPRTQSKTHLYSINNRIKHEYSSFFAALNCIKQYNCVIFRLSWTSFSLSCMQSILAREFYIHTCSIPAYINKRIKI